MEKKSGKILTTTLAIILVVLAIVRLGEKQAKSQASKHQSRIMMDTVVSIRIYRADAGQIDQAMEAAFDEIGRIEGLLSAWIPESDVSEINRAAGQRMISVDPETWQAIDKIQALSELTQGAFDITIGSVLALWDFSSPAAAVPDEKTIQRTLQLVGPDQILRNSLEQKIGLRQPGAAIDLGGAAKGYAVDRALETLRSRGVEAAVVDAGGDIGFLGRKFGGEPWKVGIRDPRNTGSTIEIIDVDSGAVATSGNYERFFVRDQVHYHHILDPKTGLPAPDVVSVTIMAQTAVEADLLSTAVFVLGPTRGMTLIEQLAGVEGVIYVDRPGGLHRVASSNFPKSSQKSIVSEAYFPSRRSS